MNNSDYKKYIKYKNKYLNLLKRNKLLRRTDVVSSYGTHEKELKGKVKLEDPLVYTNAPSVAPADTNDPSVAPADTNDTSVDPADIINTYILKDNHSNDDFCKLLNFFPDIHIEKCENQENQDLVYIVVDRNNDKYEFYAFLIKYLYLSDLDDEIKKRLVAIYESPNIEVLTKEEVLAQIKKEMEFSNELIHQDGGEPITFVLILTILNIIFKIFGNHLSLGTTTFDQYFSLPGLLQLMAKLAWNFLNNIFDNEPNKFVEILNEKMHGTDKTQNSAYQFYLRIVEIFYDLINKPGICGGPNPSQKRNGIDCGKLTLYLQDKVKPGMGVLTALEQKEYNLIKKREEATTRGTNFIYDIFCPNVFQIINYIFNIFCLSTGLIDFSDNTQSILKMFAFLKSFLYGHSIISGELISQLTNESNPILLFFKKIIGYDAIDILVNEMLDKAVAFYEQTFTTTLLSRAKLARVEHTMNLRLEGVRLLTVSKKPIKK
jgi:hypothetical protein